MFLYIYQICYRSYLKIGFSFHFGLKEYLFTGKQKEMKILGFILHLCEISI